MILGEKIALVADVPFVAREWRNQEEIRRWCRQYTLINEKQHGVWFEKMQTDPSIKMFGIVSQLERELVLGVCGFTSIDKHNQTAEFSLYIRPEHQKQGYGVDALKTLFRHGFMDHNFNRIWGETFDGNHALQMFLKLGMKHEGTSREAYFRNGKYIDCHRIGLLRSEWNG